MSNANPTELMFLSMLVIQYQVVFDGFPEWMPADPIDREAMWETFCADREHLGKHICALLEILNDAWPAYAAGVKVEAE